MPTALWIALLFALVAPVFAAPAKPLQKFENCTFVPTDWADGDSFRIKTATGEEHTIRLYGVDCLELHLNPKGNVQRLREQRRYFGITAVAPTVEASIEIAKGYARSASDKTAALLARPFTLHTRFTDGMGDPRFKRVYGIITCADGSDLASELVKSGLARAWGLDSNTPDGKTLKESEGVLADLELQTAKRGTGIWAMTDWIKLPAERQLQRKENAEFRIARAGPRLPANFKLNPNIAERLELVKLPGIKAALADLIIKNRPYAKAEDLLKVKGIGEAKLKAMRPYLVFPEP